MGGLDTVSVPETCNFFARDYQDLTRPGSTTSLYVCPVAGDGVRQDPCTVYLTARPPGMNFDLNSDINVMAHTLREGSYDE